MCVCRWGLMWENNGCNVGEGMHCMGLDGENSIFLPPPARDMTQFCFLLLPRAAKNRFFFLVLAGKKESPASRTFPPIFTPHNAKKILGPLVTQVGAPGTFFVSPPPHFCAMSREERRFVACDPSSFFLSFSFLGFCFCLHPPSLAFLRRVFLSIPPPPPCFTTRAGGGGGGGGGGGERNN